MLLYSSARKALDVEGLVFNALHCFLLFMDTNQAWWQLTLKFLSQLQPLLALLIIQPLSPHTSMGIVMDPSNRILPT